MAVGAAWLARGDGWCGHASGVASARKGRVHWDVAESRDAMGM
jgi:hypothetical protein